MFVDPQGLDTTRTTVTNGRIQIKVSPEIDDILIITDEDGNKSTYIYDPGNADANNQGYVGAGTAEELESVTVTEKNNKYAFITDDQFMWAIDAGLSITETSRSTFRLTNGLYNGNVLSPRLYKPSLTLRSLVLPAIMHSLVV